MVLKALGCGFLLIFTLELYTQKHKASLIVTYVNTLCTSKKEKKMLPL